jgi:hypothetical protein
VLTIFLERKGTRNMPGESHEGFFHFSIKREHFYAFGFCGWSQFVQREVAPDHDPVVLKIEVLPVQKKILRDVASNATSAYLSIQENQQDNISIDWFSQMH